MFIWFTELDLLASNDKSFQERRTFLDDINVSQH